MKRNNGFTLIELIIVICIMLVLAGISVPSFVAWSKNARFKEAAQTAYLALRQAKGQAININQKVTMRFTLDNSTINDNNSVAIGTGTAPTIVYAPATLFNKGIEIRGKADCTLLTGDMLITFKPDGGAGTNDGAYICIFDGAVPKYRAGVVNTTTGRIVIEKWQEGASWP